MPPISHIIFIPTVLMLGFVFGYVFGGRAARDADASRKVAEENKAARRAQREANRARASNGDKPSP